MLSILAGCAIIVVGLHQAVRPEWAIEVGRKTAPIGLHPALVPLSDERYRAVVRYGGLVLVLAGCVWVYFGIVDIFGNGATYVVSLAGPLLDMTSSP